MDGCMDVAPPKSTKSRIRPRPWTGDTLEPECEILEPGDEGYEAAGDASDGRWCDRYALGS